MIVNQHQQLRLSEASDNVADFLKLSDEYLMKSIQHSSAPELGPARTLVRRIASG